MAPKRAPPPSAARSLATATSRARELATIAGSTASWATWEVAPITPQPIDRAATRASAPLAVDHDGRAASSARPLSRLEHGDDLPDRRRRDGERLTEVQVIGEIAVERVG